MKGVSRLMDSAGRLNLFHYPVEIEARSLHARRVVLKGCKEKGNKTRLFIVTSLLNCFDGMYGIYSLMTSISFCQPATYNAAQNPSDDRGDLKEPQVLN